MARHVSAKHGVNSIALRDMAEVPRRMSICDPLFSEECANRPQMDQLVANAWKHAGKGTAVREARRRQYGRTFVERRQLVRSGRSGARILNNVRSDAVAAKQKKTRVRDSEILVFYRRGQLLKDIAERVGVHPDTVRFSLKRSDVFVDHRRRDGNRWSA